MILPLLGLLIGALAGVFLARRRGGKALDLLQWGVVVAIMGGVLGMFVLIAVERAAM